MHILLLNDVLCLLTCFVIYFCTTTWYEITYYFYLSYIAIWNLYCVYFQRGHLKYQTYIKAEQLKVKKLKHHMQSLYKYVLLETENKIVPTFETKFSCIQHLSHKRKHDGFFWPPCPNEAAQVIGWDLSFLRFSWQKRILCQWRFIIIKNILQGLKCDPLCHKKTSVPITTSWKPQLLTSFLVSPLEILPLFYGQSYTYMWFVLSLPPFSFLFCSCFYLWRHVFIGFCMRLRPFVTFKYYELIRWPVFRIEHHLIGFWPNDSDRPLAFLMSGLGELPLCPMLIPSAISDPGCSLT